MNFLQLASQKRSNGESRSRLQKNFSPMLSRPTGECNQANPEDIPQTQETEGSKTMEQEDDDDEVSDGDNRGDRNEEEQEEEDEDED